MNLKPIVLTLISAGLASMPAVGQTDPVENTHKPHPNSRTWTVYQETTGDPHVHTGQRFRIEKTGANARLVPLHAMRTDWGLAPGSKIDLSKTTGSVKRYCGEFEIHDADHTASTHTQHVVAIQYDEVGDFIAIAFAERDTGTFTQATAQCQSLTIHGGVAHAEN